jgi:hypothetical protein
MVGLKLSLDLSSILTRSTQKAKQVQDYPDQHNRTDYPQPPACPPSGIPVIPAASTEQQQQNYN